jgi:hypothetical protein
VKGAAAQHILAAVYAAGALPIVSRTPTMAVLRKAMRWSGPLDRRFIAHLSGLDRTRTWSARAFHDPVQWAIGVLGLAGAGSEVVRVPTKAAVQRQFREMLRAAHPDHGGAHEDAADRIADLTEARRILLEA